MAIEITKDRGMKETGGGGRQYGATGKKTPDLVQLALFVLERLMNEQNLLVLSKDIKLLLVRQFFYTRNSVARGYCRNRKNIP